MPLPSQSNLPESTQALIPAELFREIIKIIKAIAQTKKEDASEIKAKQTLLINLLAPYTGQTINETRYSLDLSNTRSTLSIAQFAIEALMDKISEPEENLAPLMDVLEILFRQGVLSYNTSRAMAVDALLGAYGFPSDLTDLVNSFDTEEATPLAHGRRIEQAPLLHLVVGVRLFNDHKSVTNVLKILDLFYKYGADFNIRGQQNSTALHVAARANNYSLLEKLHLSGCGFNILDSHNFTPYDIAVEHFKYKGALGGEALEALRLMGAKTSADVNLTVHKPLYYRRHARTSIHSISIGKSDLTARARTEASGGVGPQPQIEAEHDRRVADFNYRLKYTASLEGVKDLLTSYNPDLVLFRTEQGRSIVDILMDDLDPTKTPISRGLLVGFFNDNVIRTALQSQLPPVVLRRCLETYDREVAKLASKQRQLEKSASESESVVPTESTNVALASATFFGTTTLSNVKISAVIKNEKKFLAAIEQITTPEAFRALVNDAEKNFAIPAFNNFIDLCIKAYPQKDTVIPPPQELEAMRKEMPKPAAKFIKPTKSLGLGQ
jgi:hypothetical protein